VHKKTHARNPGIEFDASWLTHTAVNRAAVERRVQSLPGCRTVKKEWQAAWLLKAISCIDLTTLSGDDTDSNVMRLCAKAMQPVRLDILQSLGAEKLNLTVGAVCVYHDKIDAAKRTLGHSQIPIAAVSTGFPAGLSPFHLRLEEITESVNAGATEIDIVLSRSKVLLGDWHGVYQEVRQMRERCGEAHLKTILATGDLGTLSNVYKASVVCMMAGADFIKTSTGKEPTNATPNNSLVMVRAIRDYFERTNYKVGFKPAGGIRTAKQSLDWLILMREELGIEWQQPELFRLGASSLLSDIERQLEHFATGNYAAYHHQPMA
jgi:deoxyribose-phosphate aldolase